MSYFTGSLSLRKHSVLVALRYLAAAGQTRSAKLDNLSKQPSIQTPLNRMTLCALCLTCTLRRGSLDHLAWAKSRCNSFFTYCCSSGGLSQRKHRCCNACDAMLLIMAAVAPSFSFCQTLSTNTLESINGSIAAQGTKTSDFSVSTYARADIAVLKRLMPIDEMAGNLRHALGLSPLGTIASGLISSRERQAPTWHLARRSQRSGRSRGKPRE